MTDKKVSPDLLKIVDKAWKKDNNEYSIGLCQICDVCGGGSISNCQCAYDEFKNDKISEIMKKLDIEWNNNKKSSSELCEVCNICGEGDNSFCKCARADFNTRRIKKMLNDLN